MLVASLASCGGSDSGKDGVSEETDAQGASQNANSDDSVVANDSVSTGDRIEVYRAYRDVLILERYKVKRIDSYWNRDWVLPEEYVSFIDIDDVSSPLMIVETREGFTENREYWLDDKITYTFSNYLNMYLYEDVLLKIMDLQVGYIDMQPGAYALFSDINGSIYYVSWHSQTGSLNIVKHSIKDGTLKEEDILDCLCTVFPEWEDDVAVYDIEWQRTREDMWGPDVLSPQYSLNGHQISQEEFFSRIDDILNGIKDMTVNNMPEIVYKAVDGMPEKTFSLVSLGRNVMTYDEAIEWLDGKIGDTTDLLSAPSFTRVSASSVRAPIGNNSYEPEMAIDGSMDTAWCEGAPGNGAGEWIELEADTPQTVCGIWIRNGYQKSLKTYQSNNTVAEVRVITDEGEYVWQLENDYYDHIVSIEHFMFDAPIKTKTIRFIIEKVNEQGDLIDTLITGIGAF